MVTVLTEFASGNVVPRTILADVVSEVGCHANAFAVPVTAVETVGFLLFLGIQELY